MKQFILGLLAMLLATIAFTFIRKFIFKRSKEVVKDITGFGCTVGNVYKKDGSEVFQWNKFKKIFSLGSGIEWIKSIKEIIDLRKLVIYTIILSCIFSYGYFRGKGDTPIKVNLDYNKEFKMKLDGHYLVKPKNSQNIQVEDEKGNIIKKIKAKDFPNLAKKLKPIGFIFEPIGIVGYGASTVDSGMEGGAGVSFLKYWKWKLDTFLTNKGIYLGTSYQLTDNSGLGLGAGKGFKGDNRIIFYYKFKF